MKKIPEPIRDDLKQHVFILLLEKTDDFILERYATGKLKPYIVSIIYNLVRFKQDKFNRVHRRETENITDFTIIDDYSEDSISGNEKICHNLSSTKAIYDTLLREYQFEQNDKNEREIERECSGHLEKVYWYNKTLFKMYVELGNYRAVAKETGIPLKSVYNAIQQAREQIKTKLCQQ